MHLSRRYFKPYRGLKRDLTLSLYCPHHIPATVAGKVTGIVPMETVALTYKELADCLSIKVESARKPHKGSVGTGRLATMGQSEFMSHLMHFRPQ